MLDGKSIVPLLRGDEALEREAIFWHFPRLPRGLLQGARDIAFRTRPCGVVRAGDFKLIEYFEDGTLELYNLEEDLSEKNDLAREMPDKVKEMLGIMKSWRKSVNAPVPTERNPAFGAGNKKQP